MSLVATRGRAMAEASAVTPTGMAAVLGGDPDEVLATLERHGLTPANVNGAGQVVAAGTLEQIEAFRADPPAKARVIPLQVAGAFHTHHMAPAVERPRGAAADLSPADPDAHPAVQRRRPGRHRRRRRRDPTRAPGEQPRALGPVHGDPLDLGVTGLLELAPAGTLVGLAKRAMTGVETVALKTPDDLDAARALVDDRTVTPPPPPLEKATSDLTLPPPHRHAPRPRAPARSSTPGAPRHSRMLGVGAYRPARVVMNSEIVDKIDSSDEWIRERSGIVSRHFAADDESVIDMAEHASRQALEHAGITADQIGFVLVATVTHPYQTPAAAPELAARLGSTAPAVDISAACAGYCYGVAMASDMVKGGSADYVLVVGVEKLSDFTDPYDRGSAFIFGDGAGACVIGPSDTPGIGPTVWGSDGVQRDAISQRQAWTEVRESWKDAQADKAVWPNIGMAGQTRLPLGGLGHGARRAAGDRRAPASRPTTSTPSSRTRPTSASSTRWSSSSSCRPTSPSPATSSRPPTPRPPRSRSPRPACSPRARSPAVASRCRSASAPGSSYAAQVIVLP